MTARDRGWRVPSALTAALAAVLLLLSPVGHAWAGDGDTRSVAQSQTAHHDEAVTTSTASRASGVGCHATDLALPSRDSLGDPSAVGGPIRLALYRVTEATPDAASARAPPLTD